MIHVAELRRYPFRFPKAFRGLEQHAQIVSHSFITGPIILLLHRLMLPNREAAAIGVVGSEGTTFD
jgi:hypothetical protein